MKMRADHCPAFIPWGDRVRVARKATGRAWLVDHDGDRLRVELAFTPPAEASDVAIIKATIVDQGPVGWFHIPSQLERRKPRTGELVLTVTSNLEARGPLQPWEVELLTPLVREFLHELLADGRNGAADAEVVVLPTAPATEPSGHQQEDSQ